MSLAILEQKHGVRRFGLRLIWLILVKERLKTIKLGCWKHAEGDTKNLVHSTLTTGECDDEGDDLHAPHGR